MEYYGKADNAKQKTEKEEAKEVINLAIMGNLDENRNLKLSDFKKEIENMSGEILDEDENTITVKYKNYEAVIDIKNKRIEELYESNSTVSSKVEEIPEQWEITRKTDKQWYHYGNGKINAPKLVGEMTPIKYIGQEQEGNKWANAVTKDGSMWVWLPRYAYKITEGYHTNIAGTIEVAFLDTNNNFLNGETGELVTEPSQVTYTNNTQDQWLVHPAFTANATNGGGFGEIEGLWVGKFEATGTNTNLSVKPGVSSLVDMTINEQYKLAKASKFGETVDLRSHMAKNSEWGAVVYLAYSKYGTDKQEIEQNVSSSHYTGGSNDKETIYKANKTQSTTHNRDRRI